MGHAAIQLAAWSGAEVIATVSGDEKANLASAAGAHHTFNYRVGDAAERIRALVPDGVDIVVEVAPAVNAELDAHVVGENAVVACYATDGGGDVTLPVYPLMLPNVRYPEILTDEADEESELLPDAFVLPESAMGDVVRPPAKD